ncbi:histidine kinase [Neisseria sp. ZJ106]|uniref:Sensor protein n=1 Tax=Neisseria lisongii TaxID=2912188 RepID=A0ABY7RPB4_9NEIS|nr:histidine kinase [Neisseria lisongii]MCF7521290.1 histidine kinase [Neisseria lisongii]WCL72095.1 histidine kinase [Neisseria lisongii]
MKLFSRFSDGLSLSARLKWLTFFWVSSALFSVILTLQLSWRLENTGTAINDAGRLKTQIYHLAYMSEQGSPPQQINHQIHLFDKTFQKISNSDMVHPLIPSDIPMVYELIQSMLTQDWERSIRPVISEYRRPDQIDLYRFTGNLELFVQALENANNKNTQWLRRFQMALILMIFVAAGFMIMLHYAWIIHPLETLREGVRTISRGGFGVEIDTEHIREFAQVSKGFNQMSASLKTLYTDLEGQVARQTQDLERQNRDLALLYQTTRDLHQIHKAKTAAEEFLTRTLPAFSAAAGCIRLIDTNGRRTDPIAVIGLPEALQQAEQRFDFQRFLHTRSAERSAYLGNAAAFFAQHGDSLPDQDCPFAHIAVFPIRYKAENLGLLTLYFSDGITLADNDHELLLTLCSQLGVSIANGRFAQERRQLAVLQERNLIAQGLHDSIAQTLTFLNLQVQMLESAFDADKKDQVEENIRFIKDGVQECYDDVRELLLNFRTKISNKDFPEAVSTLLTRFEQQTQIEVNTVWLDEGLRLDNEEQLQVIFILQESLSNIRKHAHARQVDVRLINKRDFTLQISDDGIGFDTGGLSSISGEHVGLGIMQERARRINAGLSVQSQLGHGTTVTLILPQQKRTAS